MTSAPPPMIQAYCSLSSLAVPLTGALLSYRTKRGKEDKNRRSERYGRSETRRPEGPVIWVHAASVGETNAVMPLLNRILEDYPALSAVLTTTTVTSAKLVSGRLPPRTLHQFVPIDMRPHVRRFLTHWRPSIAIFAESELWPNLLLEAQRAGTRLALVNGRMSARSHSRWKRAPRTISHLLSAFDLCLAQSELDAARIVSLGARQVVNTGNLKFDAPALMADDTEARTFTFRLARRPVWVAASTHAGEEEIAIDAHLEIARRHPSLLTILAPRHPDRAEDVASLLDARDIAYQRRSKTPLPNPGTNVFLVDTIGELGLVYRATDIVFMGGSLIPHGGQNPIEPARLTSAILHGPHVGNFTEVYSALDRSGGAEEVRGSMALAQAIERLIDNPRKTAMRADAARLALQPFSGALERSFAALAPMLDQAAARP
ncbi:MAG: 3-deoxy-D-manno-octulosonic acid transferase [Pseudomonadota bacterium]